MHQKNVTNLITLFNISLLKLISLETIRIVKITINNFQQHTLLKLIFLNINQY